MYEVISTETRDSRDIERELERLLSRLEETDEVISVNIVTTNDNMYETTEFKIFVSYRKK